MVIKLEDHLITNYQIRDIMNSNEKWHIDYDYVHFHFPWTWIRNKQLIYEGNQNSGVLLITDEDGIILKALGYEKINEVDRKK